jgi:CHAT domain
MAGELATVLSQIRALDGFATFGQPPALSELLAEAAAGPIVTFNISRYRSDALLLTGDGVTSLPLPGLAQDTLEAQVISFHEALRAAADREASTGTRAAAQGTLQEILGWLWDTAAEPVLGALGYHRQPPPGMAWPRIWWAPGGRLSLLPIHAAGHHLASPASGPGRRTVMDRVISSYTPTIRALRYARQHRASVPAGGPALIVAMPVTPGLPDGALPHVTAEAARVRAHLPGAIELAEPPWPPGTSYAIPTRANVLANLAGCTIAHFACHGASHPADPSRSLLLLHDYDQHPLTVASLAPVNLSRAQLAYLSACRTAFTSAPGLFDEATHLTTAFQLAGFTHVIGTLWEINDQVAVVVADDFYTALQAGSGVVDTSRSAAALNHPVRALRDRYLLTPSLWAAYLHAGP